MHGRPVSDEPGPADPLYWPEAPTWDATFHDGHDLTGWSRGWTVARVPPGGWPFVDAPYDRAQYGPEGTVWIFDEGALFASFVGLPENPTRSAVQFALRKFGVVLGGGTLLGWRTPDTQVTPPEVRTMRWGHVTIVGQIGTDEGVAHTLNVRSAPTADADKSEADIDGLATLVRDKWVAFLAATGPGGLPVAKSMPTLLKYTEVRAAYLEQTTGAAITTHTSRKTGHPVKDFAYPRPTYLVHTRYAPFTTGNVGTSTQVPLPYEVACCLSLTTGQRGPRNRGRLYLGPLTQDLMGDSGNFDVNKIPQLATAFQGFIHSLNLDPNWRVHVVSRAYATSVGVNGIRVGVVPDSQRRRRRSRPELFANPLAT
jgi:hypothetical protein